MIKRSYRHPTLKARASLAQGGHGLEALERIAPFRFPISESAGKKPLERRPDNPFFDKIFIDNSSHCCTIPVGSQTDPSLV